MTTNRKPEDKYYLRPEQSLVLVVDIQEKLFPAVANPYRVLRQTNLLLHAARTFQLPVVVTEQNPAGLGPTLDTVDLKGLNMVKLDKMTFSAVTPKLLEVLRSYGKKQIIVAGIETHVCVLQTVRDLQREGYQCYLAADAVDSRTELNYRCALELMREMGAVITSAEIITFDLLQTAEIPEFKVMLRRIK